MHLHISRWFYEQIIDRTAFAPSSNIYKGGGQKSETMLKICDSKLI